VPADFADANQVADPRWANVRPERFGNAAEDEHDVLPSDGGTAITPNTLRIDDDEPVHHRLHRHLRRHHEEWAGTNFMAFVFHVGVMGAVAYLYLKNKPMELPQFAQQEREPELGRNVFAFGLFDEKECWGDDYMICLCSMFCLPIQWAETMSHEKVRLIGGFWVAFAMATLACQELADFTFGISHIVFVIFAVTHRQKLRKKFGLSAGTPETYFQDILVWCCCVFCAAAQEARQVQRVSLPGTNAMDELLTRAPDFENESLRSPQDHSERRPLREDSRDAAMAPTLHAGSGGV